MKASPLNDLYFYTIKFCFQTRRKFLFYTIKLFNQNLPMKALLSGNQAARSALGLSSTGMFMQLNWSSNRFLHLVETFMREVIPRRCRSSRLEASWKFPRYMNGRISTGASYKHNNQLLTKCFYFLKNYFNYLINVSISSRYILYLTPCKYFNFEQISICKSEICYHFSLDDFISIK